MNDVKILGFQYFWVTPQELSIITLYVKKIELYCFFIIIVQQPKMYSNTRYNLRKNNYKEILKLKITNEISKNATQMEISIDKKENINRVRKIYKLLNDNIDLFYTHSQTLDSAYNRITILSRDIDEFMNNKPFWMQRIGYSALLQLSIFKKKYKNYWETISTALNSKVCPDMVREIIQYI